MFNLFGKKEHQREFTVGIDDMMMPQQLPETAVSVAEIHSAFKNAHKELLAESQEFSQRPQEFDFDKIEKLKDIGFVSCKTVSEVNSKIENIRHAAAIAQNILYYSGKYPGYPLITTSKINKLCEKYGLVLAMPHTYIGEIPQKNIDEILKFYESADISDICPATEHWGKSIDAFDLVVVAPRSMFRLSPNERFDALGKIVNNDPIVLQKVKDIAENKYNLFLVITAWGDEENIEEIK